MPDGGRALSIYIASPLGQEGRGGIDRLMDMIIGEIEGRDDLGVAVTRITTRGDGSFALSPFYLTRAIGQISLARLRKQIDVLHINLSTHGSTYRKMALATWARSLGVPYILHLHGGRYERFLAAASQTLVARIRRMFAGSQSVIVLGDYWAGVVVSRFPEAGDKLTVLPNASPSGERLSADGGPVRIVFLGKLVKAKGVAELVAALGQLRDRPSWTATIAGDGDTGMWRRRAEGLGIAGRVDFPGWLGPEEASMRLRQADIFVLPSFFENLPVSLVEAFGVGVATITTPVGAIPEVVRDGENGILVAPGDENALAGALKRLLDDPELRRHLGNNAQRDHASRYEIGDYLTRLVSIWKQASTAAHRA